MSAATLRCRLFSGIVALAVAALAANAAGPTAKPPAAESGPRPPSPIVPRSNQLTAEPWNGVSITPLAPAELDKLLAAELWQDHIQPAAIVNDEGFIRRVSLDLTGRMPTLREISDFAR